MVRDVLWFHEIDRTQVLEVGGKGAHLAELSRLDGVRVPDGFCISTAAFARSVAGTPIGDSIAIPPDLVAEITAALRWLGEDARVAVRSSATAEDSPTASFAGQHDSFLNVGGASAVLEAVRRCWASLHSDRAVSYRARNGIEERTVRMGVVVQRMVAPTVSGVLFTADPVTGNRRVSAVEASPGIGEDLVAGRVNADQFTVRDGEVLARTIRGGRPALSDAQLQQLDALGRRIERHFGAPQDIEWCLDAEGFQVVQARPITTLFPIPVATDGQPHVYLSVGHQQMMTDAMKPLGVSFRQLTAAAPFHEAGGRVFVDVGRALATTAGRAGLLAMRRYDPLTCDALESLIARDFVPLASGQGGGAPAAGAPPASPQAPAPIATDPAIVAELVAANEASVAVLRRGIEGRTGVDLLDFIERDFAELKRVLMEPRSHQVFMSAMEATFWLADHLQEWLGEKDAADTLTQSAPGNVTSEMGLALMDVADAIRPHREVVSLLVRAGDAGFLDALPGVRGGAEARSAIVAWLDRFGMRGVGEIDITRPRWSERPELLLPLILGNVRQFSPGESQRRFQRGAQAAFAKEAEILARLRTLPGGEEKARETKERIDRLRTFIGYREYPKYGMMSRYLVYKRALMAEADRLTSNGVIRDREEIFFLTFAELREAVRAQRVDDRLVAARREEFRRNQALTPPRVLTSEGESVVGSYRRGAIPAGALVGLAVSAGTVEGRARVVLEIADAALEQGDILVTPFTDPSWTPVFVTIRGLVTEMGGPMTHGAVIAREYGLPAVVGVDGATQRIRDGQRIRVNGTEGTVEVLD